MLGSEEHIDHAARLLVSKAQDLFVQDSAYLSGDDMVVLFSEFVIVQSKLRGSTIVERAVVSNATFKKKPAQVGVVKGKVRDIRGSYLVKYWKAFCGRSSVKRYLRFKIQNQFALNAARVKPRDAHVTDESNKCSDSNTVFLPSTCRAARVAASDHHRIVALRVPAVAYCT